MELGTTEWNVITALIGAASAWAANRAVSARSHRVSDLKERQTYWADMRAEITELRKDVDSLQEELSVTKQQVWQLSMWGRQVIAAMPSSVKMPPLPRDVKHLVQPEDDE